MSSGEEAEFELPKFRLADAMISQKVLKEQTRKLKKLKQISIDTQVLVREHDEFIKSELIDESKLKITVEMLKNELVAHQEVKIGQIADKYDARYDNCVKQQELKQSLRGKITQEEFQRTIKTMNESFILLEAKVVNAIPAIKAQVKNGMESKAEQIDLDKLNHEKANLSFVEAILSRLNTLEEQMNHGARKRPHNDDDSLSQLTEEDGEGSNSDYCDDKFQNNKEKENIANKVNIEDIQIVPGNKQLNTKKINETDSMSSRQSTKELNQSELEEAKTQFNNSHKSPQNKGSSKILNYDSISGKDTTKILGKQTIEQFEQINKTQEDLQIKFDEVYSHQMAQKVSVQKLEGDLEKVLKEVRKLKTDRSGARESFKVDQGLEFDVSNQPTDINKKIKAIEKEITNLVARSKDDLLAKPIKHADRIKDQIYKEFESLKAFVQQSIDTTNKRASQIDLRLNHNQQEVQKLIDLYKKKIGQVGKDVTKSQQIMDLVNIKINTFDKKLGEFSEHFEIKTQTNQVALDDMRERINKEMKDLKAENQGFCRELERQQVLFRQLQTELVVTLEEKKETNNMLQMTSTEISSNNKTSNQFLPSLKESFNKSNAQLTLRQEKIASIVKGDKFKNLIPDPSNMTIKTNYGGAAFNSMQNSSKAFVTTYTPNRGRPSSIAKEDAYDGGIKTAKYSKVGFNLNKASTDFLDRQKDSKYLNQRNLSQDLQKSQDAEFKQLHELLAENMQK